MSFLDLFFRTSPLTKLQQDAYEALVYLDTSLSAKQAEAVVRRPRKLRHRRIIQKIFARPTYRFGDSGYYGDLRRFWEKAA